MNLHSPMDNIDSTTNITLPLILASTSVFRRKLLEKLGQPFECFAPDIDESAHNNESARALVQRLATLKAQAATIDYSRGLAIGSDQVCVNDGIILGKPDTHEIACRQLRNASGRTIRFYTGLCVYNIEQDTHEASVDTFDVTFRELSPQLIEDYLSAEQPYQCAGSFKSEGMGVILFKKLSGKDYNSLIGLPLIMLVDMLQNAGYRFEFTPRHSV